MALSSHVRDQIERLIHAHRVTLFMKGNREQPQCGFSAQVVQILDQLLPEYETFDVFSDPQIREGIKEYANWPTIPQLYVRGEFMGGCDIVREMYESGELRKLLGLDAPSAVAPQITITEAGARALRAAAQRSGGEGD